MTMTNASGTHRSVQRVMPSPQFFKNSKVPRPSPFFVSFIVDSSFVTTRTGITAMPSTRQGFYLAFRRGRSARNGHPGARETRHVFLIDPAALDVARLPGAHEEPQIGVGRDARAHRGAEDFDPS